MKIAIIGGLGYLGSHLTHRLEQENEVVIYDTNIFNSSYVPNKAKVRNKNFLDLDEEELEKYDVVLICSTIDIGSFYTSDFFKQYAQDYIDKVVSCNNLVETGVVLFTSMDQNLNTLDGAAHNYEKLLLKTIENTNYNRNVCIVPVPELYGGHLRVRSDLFVNNMLSEFLQLKRYVVEDDILRHVCFTHVTKFVKQIEQTVDNMDPECGYTRSEDFDYCEMSRLMIANYVSWMLGQEYELYTIPDDNMCLEMDGNYSFSETSELEYTIALYTKMQEERKISEFFNIHSNNRYIVNNSLIGNQFTKSILNDKSVSKSVKPVTAGGNFNGK